MKRAIGLAVLIIVVIGLPLVLSNSFGPQNKSVNDRTMRQITIETTPSGGGSGQTAQSGTKSDMPDFADATDSMATHHTAQSTASSGVPSDQATRDQTGSEPIAANTGAGVSTPDNSRQAQSHSVSRTDKQRNANGMASNQAEPESTSGHDGSESGGQNTGGEGDWVVQVASFGTLDQAQTFMSRMDKYASFYAVGEVDGTTYYRVRIGPFTSENKAERVADELATENRKPYALHR